MVKCALVMKYKKALITVLLLVLVLSGLNIYAGRESIKAFLAKGKLIKQEEPFTELYFIDPDSLNHELTEDESVEFKFRVYNMENKPTRYSWKATLIPMEEFGQELSIDSGQFFLNNGEFKDQLVYFRPGKLIGRHKILIELPELKQSIHYFVVGKE